MKTAEALHQVKRLFLDTAPVIYYVEKNPRYLAVVAPIFDRIDGVHRKLERGVRMMPVLKEKSVFVRVHPRSSASYFR